MESKVIWIEIWLDESTLRYSYPYFLLLRAYDNGSFETRDPQKGYALGKKFNSYEEAILDLEEDEYERIEGRRLLED